MRVDLRVGDSQVRSPETKGRRSTRVVVVCPVSVHRYGPFRVAATKTYKARVHVHNTPALRAAVKT